MLAPYFSRTRGDIRPGVHRVRALLAACGLPALSPKPRIIVAGTNGKGTTCALLESALRECGARTGLYTSPHLVHPGERIRVAGVPATESELAPVVGRVDAAASAALPDATFFEILTAAAFVRFEEARTDVDVVEVGLGGRYDSTNVIAPTVSVLVSVGLDHVELLGNDETSIAFDKAHVSRRGRPLVCGPLSDSARAGVQGALSRTGAFLVDGSANSQLKGTAAEAASLLERMGGTGSDGPRDYGHGRGLDPNRRLALAVLAELDREMRDARGTATSVPSFALSPEGIARGFASAFWPGRFDVRTVRGVRVVFDAAHNSHGARYFARTFEGSPFAVTRPVFVYGSLSDKDWKEVVEVLAPLAGAFVFTQALSPRAVPAQEIASHARSLPVFAADTASPPTGKPPPRIEACLPDPGAALERALGVARDDNVACVVIGSIALLGDAMERLEVDPFDAGR